MWNTFNTGASWDIKDTLHLPVHIGGDDYIAIAILYDVVSPML